MSFDLFEFRSRLILRTHLLRFVTFFFFGYFSVILDLHFPSVVYKLLLGEHAPPITFADLAEVDESLYEGFKQLLAFDGDVSDVFDRTFEAG